MEAKQAIVTGGTGGIGLETARGLVRAGMNVLVVGRNVDAGRRAVADLSGGAGPGQQIRFEPADLSSMADIRRLATILDRDLPRLDVLVNNAGAQFPRRELTAEGFERTMATNHFSMFLLTALLFHKLAAAPAGRIVNVASDVHYMGRIDLDDLTLSRRYSNMGAYSTSKLANVMFTRELARRIAGSGVTANSLNPGVVRSNFSKYQDAWYLRWISVSTAEGARSSLYLALSPEVEGKSGGHYNKKAQLKAPSRTAQDADKAKRLWELSDALVDGAWATALAVRQPA